MFGVCLTFYIIIVVINKEKKTLQHFSDSTEIMCTPEFGLQFDTQGRMYSIDILSV